MKSNLPGKWLTSVFNVPSLATGSREGRIVTRKDHMSQKECQTEWAMPVIPITRKAQTTKMEAKEN